MGDATVERVLSVAAHVRVKKKEYLVEQGVRSTCIFFISEGLFRGVALIDGREDTLFFGLPGDPFLSMHSFAHDEPAQISLQAIEDSVVYAVTFSEFRRLLVDCPDLMMWWSSVLTEQIYALERRYVHIGTCDAAQRYETLLKIRAGIMHRIPVKYVAQYLNVTPETLSRIRAKSRAD